MNEQNFDKLFRERLSGFSQAPPPGALEKINHQLKRRHQKAWVKFSRLAAVLTLIAISVYMIGYLSDQKNERPTSRIAVKQPEIPAQTAEPSNSHERLGTQGIRKLHDLENIDLPRQQQIAVLKTVPFNEEEKAGSQQIEGQTINTIADNQAEINKPKRPKVTITYKRGPDPAASEALAVQDQPKSKSESIRKILKTVQIVDYQNLSLAGIRATKDQLLAINKKDKNKETKPN